MRANARGCVGAAECVGGPVSLGVCLHVFPSTARGGSSRARAVCCSCFLLLLARVGAFALCRRALLWEVQLLLLVQTATGAGAASDGFAEAMPLWTLEASKSAEALVGLMKCPGQGPWRCCSERCN